MTQEDAPNQPPADGPENDPGALMEKELDDILSQAASLTSELSRQLGNDEEPVASPVATTERELGGLADLEADLGELERLVGLEPDGTSETTQTPDPASTSESQPAPASVPDFMSEFTQPEEPAEPVSATPIETPQAAAGQPTPTVVTPKLGVVGSAPIGDAAEPAVAAATAADAAPADAPETTLVGRIVAAQKERLSAVTEVVAEKLVRLLELIDGRLPKFNGTVRQILGLVALATVGTSTIVLVLSLF